MESRKQTINDFEEVVRKYHQQVFRTAMGFVHSKEDAEDVTQDVFLSAYKNRDRFQGGSELVTWLYRITVNTSLNHLAKKKRRLFFTFGQDKEFERLPAAEDNPQQIMERNENDGMIRAAIDSLPDKQKTAFVLSRYDDLSQKQVAEVMQTTEGAVEQLLQRANANLRKKLKRP